MKDKVNPLEAAPNLFLRRLSAAEWTLTLSLARADLLGLAFAVLGLTAYVLRPSWFYSSAALFLAALFTKYTLVAAPASVLLHMLLTRAYRRLLGMVALLAGGAGTVAFVL